MSGMVTMGSLVLTISRLVLTVGRLVLTMGRLVLTMGRLMMTMGRLMINMDIQMLTIDAWMLTVDNLMTVSSLMWTMGSLMLTTSTCMMSQPLHLTCSWCWAVGRPGTALALLLAGGLGVGLGAGLGGGLAGCLGVGHVEVTVLGLALLTHEAARVEAVEAGEGPGLGLAGLAAQLLAAPRPQARHLLCLQRHGVELCDGLLETLVERSLSLGIFIAWLRINSIVRDDVASFWFDNQVSSLLPRSQHHSFVAPVRVTACLRERR